MGIADRSAQALLDKGIESTRASRFGEAGLYFLQALELIESWPEGGDKSKELGVISELLFRTGHPDLAVMALQGLLEAKERKSDPAEDQDQQHRGGIPEIFSGEIHAGGYCRGQLPHPAAERSGPQTFSIFPPRADLGGKRDGKRAFCPRDPPDEPAFQESLPGDQLCYHSKGIDGVRTLRLRAGGFHRRCSKRKNREI